MKPLFPRLFGKVGKGGSKASSQRGASIIEALISVGLLSFVIVSILGGFSQQQANTRNTSARNVAIRLAEMRLEDMLKFPSSQMTAETFIDYVVAKDNGFEFFDSDQNEQQQFRRTTTVTMDLLGQIANIQVLVEYPLTGTAYPFQVMMSTRRGVK